MRKIILFGSIIFCCLAYAQDDLPTWEFPILGSKFIGNNCSEEINLVIMKVSFAQNGDVQGITFLKESSVSEINEEARQNVMELSPFMEFEDMSEEEKARYRVVRMLYTIPCKNS